MIFENNQFPNHYLHFLAKTEVIDYNFLYYYYYNFICVFNFLKVITIITVIFNRGQICS